MPRKIKLLFFHFDLGNGGAEKVLVNLINNLPKDRYDITLKTIFGGGVNQNRLRKDIKYSPILKCKAFGGVSILLRMFPAAWLRKLLIRGKYDCEIAFLEAIPTRILGGLPLQKGCKRYTWVHNTLDDYDYRIFTKKVFRSMREIEKIYSHFDKIAFVSRKSISSFEDMIKTDTPKSVVHNVCEFGDMLKKSEETSNLALNRNVLNLCSVGRLCGQKGYDRLIRVLGNIHKKGYYSWHIYIIGEGPERNVLESMVKELGIGDFITFLGFQENPYKYLKQMDFFICSSIKEGYSTAVTEAICLGIPVLTTDCSGMDEIINTDYAGIIVENTEQALESGIERLLQMTEGDLNKYKEGARARSTDFTTDACVREFEDFIDLPYE